MVPAGTEPHDWEPAATDIKNLEEADLFVYSGAGMEHWADDVLASLETKRLVSAEASPGLPSGQDTAMMRKNMRERRSTQRKRNMTAANSIPMYG